MGNGGTEDDLLFHDEKMDDPSLAFLLSRMQVPAFPEPLGIFRRVHRPTYEGLMKQQIEDARSKNGSGDMTALLEGKTSPTRYQRSLRDKDQKIHQKPRKPPSSNPCPPRLWSGETCSIKP